MEHNRVVCTRPYDCEVEYLESTKTQWVDTLYKLKLSDELRFKVYCFADNGCAIFGSRGATAQNFYQLYIDEGGLAFLGFGQHSSLTIFTHINSFQRNGINEIIIKDGLCICNGVSTQIPVGTENSLQNLAIFARRNQDSSVSYLMRMKLYYFQIYHNGTLVRDFIPVRKGSIGYLYDKVSKKLFANKGTGNFILGQDVSNPVPNIRRVFRFGNKRFVMPMPYDSKIEYLESTGTQYINTLIKPNSQTEFDLKIHVLSKHLLFGGMDNNVANNDAFIITGRTNNQSTNASLFFRNTGSNNASITYNVYNVHTYSFKGGKFIIDNVVKGSLPLQTQTDTATYSIYLFNREINNRSDTSNQCIARLYSFKCYQNNTLIQDLIPVRKGNIGYLYDNVSGKLFGNAGTGQFILGNDIND